MRGDDGGEGSEGQCAGAFDGVFQEFSSGWVIVMLHKEGCLKVMLIGQRIVRMEGPGFGIIQFALLADHPLQATKEVALEGRVGVDLCVVAEGGVPLAAAIKFMAPDRGKDRTVKIRFILIYYTGEIVNSEHVDVWINLFDEIAFVRQLPDLRQK